VGWHTLFWIFIAFIVVVALPFGALHSWTWGLASIIVGILLLGWCAECLVKRRAPAVAASQVWKILLFFAIAVGWAMLQASSLMPEEWSHPLWAEAALALGDPSSGGYISVNPHETESALVRLLTYGGVFWLALQYGRDRKCAAQLLQALALSGALYAIYGILVEFAGANSILWSTDSRFLDEVTSTFVNPNSYATFAGLGLIVSTGLLIRFIRKAYSMESDMRREQLRLLLIGLTSHGWVLMLVWALLATVLLLNASSWAVLSTCVGLTTLFVISAVSRGRRTRAAITTVIGVLVSVAAFFVLSGETVPEGLASVNLDYENRMAANGLAVSAATDTPWLGVGYGTSEEVIRMYRDRTIPDTYVNAQNIYLENAIELGIPAFASLLLAIIIAVSYCVVGIRRRRRDKIYPTIAFSAAVLVGIHSMVNFDLQVPAVGVAFALILGIGCAQSRSSRQRIVN
jgi:O-antigen ligase